MDTVAKILFEYLRDILYKPARAALDVQSLPPEFHTLGEGLRYLADCVFETKKFGQALARGDLTEAIPSRGNEIAAPLKSLHASLQHLTWQTQQVAKGDYSQRVAFMGDFAKAFNMMTRELGERRKAAADRTSTLRQYLTLLLSNCPDPLLLFDRDGRVVLASTSYLRYSKTDDPEDAQRQSFHAIFAAVADEDFVQRMDELFRAAIADKRSSQLERALALGGDGEPRHYLIQLNPMLDKEDTAVGAMLFFLDMTESMRAQREAEHARELAERAMRDKSEFFARMSHEMRTPLHAVMGMTTLARAADAPERRAYCLDRINEASQHLLGVISDMLDMSRFESESFTLSLHECDFTKMLRRVVDTLMFRITERKQTLSVTIDETLPARIVTDEQRLAQVVANLLSNAVKFTPEHGAISLDARRIAERDGLCALRVTVRDSGIGIAADQQERLFTSFEQADGGFSRQFGGTGLGLSLAKRIVDSMHGRIWVESEPGKGSAFFFEIEVRTGAEADALPVRPDASGADSPPLTGKRILVAEDVDINREILASLLEDSGLELVFAMNGQEAVAAFSADPGAHDAILMDLHMPGMDGYEATRRIRASGLQGADAIPIIAMTANVLREDIERCLASGMNSHLGKPIDLDLLVAELKKYLNVR